MRKLTRLSHVPIAILTSSESPAEMQRAYALGVIRYLRKPTMVEVFLEQVGQSVKRDTEVEVRRRASQ